MRTRIQHLIIRSTLVLLTGPALGQCELAQFDGSDTESFDRFGHAVGITATTAVVGAVNHEHANIEGGGAYIFEKSGGSWNEILELVPLDTADGDAFGAAVAISGERAIVSAPFDDDGGIDSGSVYIFARTGGVWTQEAKLTASDASENNGFGVSVGLSGDRAIVGAYRFSDFGGIFGAAYVFERNAAGWSEVDKLTPSDASADDQFGSAVAIDNDYAIVGAGGNETGQFLGAAYMFERGALGWSQVDKLTASDAASWSFFGRSVAISGETAMVSAPGHTFTAAGSGAVYVFDRAAAGWQESQIVISSDVAIGDEFARSIALSGDRAVMGVPNHAEVGNYSGAAYLFERFGTTWVEIGKLVPGDATPSDQFGFAVSIFGETAMVGAGSNDPPTGGFDSGTAYVFSTGFGTPYCASVPNSTGSPALMSSGGCGSVARNDIVLYASPVPNEPGLFFYGVDAVQLPFGNGFRCIGNTVHRLDVTTGVSGALSHELDVTAPPSPAGQITAGSTWNFQAWYRDPSGGGAFFNLSDGLRLAFQP